MYIKQTFTKEDIAGITQSFRPSSYIMTILFHLIKLFLLLADLFLWLLIAACLIFNVKTNMFSYLLYARIVFTYVGIDLKLDVKKRTSYKYLPMIEKLCPGKLEFTVEADDETITLNETAQLKWADACCGFMGKDFFIVSGKKKFTAYIKTDEMLKERICGIMDSYKKDIYLFPNARENKIYLKNSTSRIRKKRFIRVTPMVILLIWTLILKAGI